MVWRRRRWFDLGTLALAVAVVFTGAAIEDQGAARSSGTPSSGAPGTSPVVDYVALGDSYAAGQGAGAYENSCLQSPSGYPALLDDVKHVKLAADASCTGATTDDVLEQLSVLSAKRFSSNSVDLVTLTVGANDLNGAAVAVVCSLSFESPECRAAFAAALSVLLPLPSEGTSALAERLSATYAAVAAAAPDATILVTGYPYLFEAASGSVDDPAAQLNSAIAGLNLTIQTAVEQLASTGVDIRYVDVTDEFAGHGIGGADPWINAAGPDVVHPTAEGYEAYARALIEEF